jgi:hypothetical protein
MFTAQEAIAALPPSFLKIWQVIFSAASAAQMYLLVAERPIAVTSLAPFGSLLEPIGSEVSAFQMNTNGFCPF